MNTPWNKKPNAPVVHLPRSVSELVASFTSQFKEVANMNAKIVEKQDEIIKVATDKRTIAETERCDAENFIANFEAMRKAPLVK